MRYSSVECIKVINQKVALADMHAVIFLYHWYLLPASPPVSSVGKDGFRSIAGLGMAEICKTFS